MSWPCIKQSLWCTCKLLTTYGRLLSSNEIRIDSHQAIAAVLWAPLHIVPGQRLLYNLFINIWLQLIYHFKPQHLSLPLVLIIEDTNMSPFDVESIRCEHHIHYKVTKSVVFGFENMFKRIQSRKRKQDTKFTNVMSRNNSWKSNNLMCIFRAT